MPDYDSNKLQNTFNELTKNIYNYFKKAERLKRENKFLKNELKNIKIELLKIKEALEDLKKVNDEKRDKNR